MAQASKNQATASKTAKSAKQAAAPAVVDEVLEDEDVLDADDVDIVLVAASGCHGDVRDHAFAASTVGVAGRS